MGEHLSIHGKKKKDSYDTWVTNTAFKSLWTIFILNACVEGGGGDGL